MGLTFFITNIFLGVGLAMDAFSVSVANGLNEPQMRRRKIGLIALVFGGFQGAMPMIGWVCVHYFVKYFNQFEKYVPYIAFILLLYIGGKMIWESVRGKAADDENSEKLGWGDLIVQGIATSIDALSVGFTIEQYSAGAAFVASAIIAAVTLVICVGGVYIGREFGNKFSKHAQILGGLILIGIGIEILVSNLI
jgi:putative Mn2+ efflux pump MntP